MAAAKIAGLEGELQSLQAASEEVQQSLRSQLSATQVELETLKVHAGELECAESTTEAASAAAGATSIHGALL